MIDRRKYIRIPEQTQISYTIIPSEKTEEYITKDISQGGIRFMVHEFIPKDSQLRVKFSLSGSSFVFEAVVQIIWTQELPYEESYEIGVKFIDIPAEALDCLISYIKAFLAARKK